MTATVIHDDAREALGRIAPGSVDAVITDPPYHLGWSGSTKKPSVKGFMSMEWDGGSIAFEREVWELCLKTVRPGAHLLAFGGTRTYHRLMTAIEDGGWTARDVVCWHYGTGMPKHHGRLRPATDLISVARAPLDGTVARTVERHGTGRLWPERCLVPPAPPEVAHLDARRAEPPCANPMERSGAFAHWQDGSRSPVSPEGRWPANVTHDGSDAVMDLFPLTPAGRERATAARFFYEAKASPADRETGLAPASDGTRRNRHPTVKPIALMRWLIRLSCPEGGTVLDPFCGSGTTGIAAVMEGRSFVGIEQDAKYFALARERIGTT